MAYSFKIRPYRAVDIPIILDGIEEFLTEERETGEFNHYKNIDFDKDKMYRILESQVSNRKSFFVNLIVRDGMPVGGLCAQAAEYIFSQEKVAFDNLLFLRKEHANLKATIMLIESYCEWAELVGAREVLLRTSTGYKHKAFGKLLTRQGFTQFEAGYSKEI
jgi:hypothetical protein